MTMPATHSTHLAHQRRAMLQRDAHEARLARQAARRPPRRPRPADRTT
jgi:hypothetical protein